LAESVALFIKSEPQLDPIIGDGSISDASRPLNILHMCLISDVEMKRWLLVAHLCQAMPIFQQQLAESLAISSLNFKKN
jgi:hypothetical protein